MLNPITVGAMVAALGVLVAAFGLRYAWMSNFVAAWTRIVDDLQEPKVRVARGFLKYLYGEKAIKYEEKASKCKCRCCWLGPLSHTKNPIDIDTWPKTLKNEQLEHWTNILKESSTDDDIIAAVKKGYDCFDLTGILVLHSSIPGLKQRFIAEYQDSIVACWEMGVPLFLLRAKGNRRSELYNCFSVLYVLARRLQYVKIRDYPHFGNIDQLKLLVVWNSFWWNPFAVHRKARKLRDALLELCVPEAE